MTDKTSPSAEADDRPERLTIGRIASPHGVRGEMRMYVLTHFPERIPDLSAIYFGDESEPRQLGRVRFQGNLAIIRVEGITSREMADEYRQQLVQIDFEDAAPLEEGEFYHFEIIGLQAYTEDGAHLGEVVDIIETGANDVYVIRDDEGNETLIPALYEAVPDINPDEGRITVRPLDYSGEG